MHIMLERRHTLVFGVNYIPRRPTLDSDTLWSGWGTCITFHFTNNVL